jgi:hypothetical protein
MDNNALERRVAFDAISRSFLYPVNGWRLQFFNESRPYRSKKEIRMNPTKGSPCGTNKEIAKNMLDVRIILAVLWVAGMLSSLNGDTYRLHAGTVIVPPGLLLVMSILFVGSIFMSALTLMLKSPMSRWVNRVMGIFYAVVILAFWVLGFISRSAGFEIVWSTAQLVLALMVVWFAWKWPNPEAWPGRF